MLSAYLPQPRIRTSVATKKLESMYLMLLVIQVRRKGKVGSKMAVFSDDLDKHKGHRGSFEKLTGIN